MSTAAKINEKPVVELTFTSVGETVTVSKHANGLYACSCRVWRFNHNSGLGTEDCNHIYKAQRKGL